MDGDIDYNFLIEKALKNVVKDALAYTEENGLGENHFYITFKTNAENVKLHPLLRNQYPDNMTIVLQHQFENLIVDENGFSVDLTFGGVIYNLTIPFDAVTYFYDPYAKFGLTFRGDEEYVPLNVDEQPDEDNPPQTLAPVISIDNFRKK